MNLPSTIRYKWGMYYCQSSLGKELEVAICERRKGDEIQILAAIVSGIGRDKILMQLSLVYERDLEIVRLDAFRVFYLPKIGAVDDLVVVLIEKAKIKVNALCLSERKFLPIRFSASEDVLQYCAYDSFPFRPYYSLEKMSKYDCDEMIEITHFLEENWDSDDLVITSLYKRAQEILSIELNLEEVSKDNIKDFWYWNRMFPEITFNESYFDRIDKVKGTSTYPDMTGMGEVHLIFDEETYRNWAQHRKIRWLEI